MTKAEIETRVAIAESVLQSRDEPYRKELKRIGSAIGYGRAQQILGELWDDMLESYGLGRGRGSMGAEIDDSLPPVPRAEKLRREQQYHGGYAMVPAYTVAELKEYALAAVKSAKTKEQSA